MLGKFEEAFIKTLDDHWLKEHGNARWRHEGSEKEYLFLIPSPLISTINQSNWVNAANKTAEGVIQIEALEGEDSYQAAVSAAITPIFDYAIKNICGEYHGKTNTSGWRVLTPIISTLVAPKDTADFEQMRIFYKAHGDETETRQNYKLAKKLITGRWFSKGSLPSAGPYLDV